MSVPSNNPLTEVNTEHESAVERVEKSLYPRLPTSTPQLPASRLRLAPEAPPVKYSFSTPPSFRNVSTPTSTDEADRIIVDRDQLRSDRHSLLRPAMATYRTSSFLQRDPTPDVLARIAVNDSALTPKPFRGNDGDAEKKRKNVDIIISFKSGKIIDTSLTAS